MRPRKEQPVRTLILRDLSDGPATVRDLEESIGVDRKNLRPYLKDLHTEKLIHVCDWEQRTGPALPVYAAGPGVNRRRPKRKYKRYEVLPTLESKD